MCGREMRKRSSKFSSSVREPLTTSTRLTIHVKRVLTSCLPRGGKRRCASDKGDDDRADRAGTGVVGPEPAVQPANAGNASTASRQMRTHKAPMPKTKNALPMNMGDPRFETASLIRGVRPFLLKSA